MGCGSSTAVPVGVLPGEAAPQTQHPPRHTPGSSGGGGAMLVVLVPAPSAPPPSPATYPALAIGTNHSRAISRISGLGGGQGYTALGASSVPSPRLSLSAAGGVSRVETDRSHVRGPTNAHHNNMPAVSELLATAGLRFGALLPNFYRSSGAGTGSGGANVSRADTMDYEVESLEDDIWGQGSDSDDLDEEEHAETLTMLQELTALSVPGLKTHTSSSTSSDSHTPIDTTSSPHGHPSHPPSHRPQPSLMHSSILSGVSALGTSSALAVPPSGAASGSASGSHTPTKPTRTSSRATGGRAHISSAGTETLFHGFYAKRCARSVKKSMANSGLYLTFRDMFERLDPTRSGVISRADWTKLLQKLGLPVDSATSLSRIVGLADTPTITLEQFAMVMALSMHGPYVRLLQSTQNARRNEVFLGGDKTPNEAGGGWRKQAQAYFAQKSVPFFNPRSLTPSATPEPGAKADKFSSALTDDAGDGEPWNAELVILEALAKSQCTLMLFVVASSTRSIASMVEASEHITSEKEVLLVMQDVAAGDTIAGETLTGPEAKDLNRGRAYLADVAHRNGHSGVTVFKSVPQACEYIEKRNSGAITRPSLKAFTKPVIALPTAMPRSPTPTPAPNAAASTTTSAAPPQVPTGRTSAKMTKAEPAMHGRDGSFHLSASSPLSMSLMSGMARRHSMGVAPLAPRHEAQPIGLPPPSAGPQLAAAAAGFPADEWPANPQPGDFDRYLLSAHFLECARIVFKHQGLLSRRAAAKAQPLVAPSLGGAAIIPSGVFRMASSPMRGAAPLKLRPSSSASNLNEVPPPVAPALTSPVATPAASPHPSGLTTLVIPVPSLRIQTANSVSSSAGSNHSPPDSGGSSGPTPSHFFSTAHAGTPDLSPRVSSALSQSRVLLRLSSQSTVQGHSTLHGPEGGASPSVTRPPTSAGEKLPVARPSLVSHSSASMGLATSSSQSKLLDPLTAAGLSVTIAPISSVEEGTVTDEPSSSAPSAIVEEDGEAVATAYLFTMLIRLHEIIQLSTGVSFLHPYPSLVAAELEKATSANTSPTAASAAATPAAPTNQDLQLLRAPEWIAIAGQVFGQLRGIHEAHHDVIKLRSGEGPEAVAAEAEIRTAVNSTGKSLLAVPSATNLAVGGSSDPPNASRRRSLTRFGTARMAVSADLGGVGLSGSGISPSQFLRQISVQKRMSGTPEPAFNAALGGGPGTPTPAADDASSAPSTYVASSRAPGHSPSESMTMASLAAAATTAFGLPSGVSSGTSSLTNHSATKPTPPPALTVANSAAIMARVTARISSQRKMIESLTPANKKSPLDEASTLSTEDLTALAASVTASLQHDQLVLKEMLPSFQSMFASIDAAAKSLGKVSMDDLRYLLEHKLQLPLQSCDSLMAVINVALASCQHEAATTTPQDSESTGLTPLPLSAFDRNTLGQPAFCAVLAKTLHLQSSPFSSFLATSGRSFVATSKRACSQVFLGGSCNPTTWRVDEAIPILDAAGVTFFNPQLPNWSQELVLIESLIKQNCEVLLFVIDSETRAIASMIEASEYICSGRDVVLVVKNLPSEDARVNAELLGPQQVHDLNRARSYVTDVAQRHGLDVFTDITLACEYIATKLKDKASKEEAYAAEVEQFVCSEEFFEKSAEEFLRSSCGRGRLNATQLLLACLHLEQDLRPLLPPQSPKHRQPCMGDVEQILAQFGKPTSSSSADGAREMDCDQFLHFSRCLFRNVCAHVKL